MTDVADGAVLLDEAAGTFFHLNRTGALVFAQLTTGVRISEVARLLASAFETDEAVMRSDIEAFVDDLTRYRLVAR